MKRPIEPRNIVRAALAIAVASACLASLPIELRADEKAPPILSPDELKNATGETIYSHVCQGCHMADGRGAQGAATYPALGGNAHLASAQFTATTVFFGRHNMPHFGHQEGLSGFEQFVVVTLNDAQIASVVNYVRSHFGNHYTDELTEADIKALHR